MCFLSKKRKGLFDLCLLHLYSIKLVNFSKSNSDKCIYNKLLR